MSRVVKVADATGSRREKSGRYVRTGTSSAILPSSASRAIAAAVNAFEHDPIGKSVSDVTGR